MTMASNFSSNTGLGRSSFSGLLPMPLRVRSSQSDWFWSFFWSKGLLNFRFTCPRRLSWRLYARVGFLALGIAYAAASLMGDMRYAQAVWVAPTFASQLEHMHSSARWFPFEFEFRRGAAMTYIHQWQTVDPSSAIGEINRAIETDPNAMDLKFAIGSFMAMEQERR